MDLSVRPAPDRSLKPGLAHRDNCRWLRAYAASRDQRRRLRWRDALVKANLPLVRQIAGRLAPRTGLAFDDLVQVGCLGLLRAIDAFDPRHGSRFSSFAVPFIRGAIAHELRDRGSLVRIPRGLWELRQRAAALRERLRGRGGVPCGEHELARRLGCPPEQLAEALSLGRLRELPSLDAPLPGAEGDGHPLCLLDLLVAPATADAAAPEQTGERKGKEQRQSEAELHWLRSELRSLTPQLQALLLGRQRQGATWVELGRELGIHPRMAQRRHDAALAQLKETAQSWRGGDREGISPMQHRSPAPDPWPSPAERRSGSAGH
jgi:RNA polymerase sigma-B factor